MQSNQILLRTAKGHFISVTMYGKRQTKSILVINSATGVKQHFYAKFAMFVAQQGIAVMTYDYHGIFQSLDRDIRKIESNASDWAKVDMEEILLYIKQEYPEAKITVMGHSIGGQMIGLAKTALSVDKIILVTAQNGYWGYWKGFGKLRMLFNWYILFPILTKVFGYMPSKKIMGMENLPQRVAEQWCRWCRHPHYLFGDEFIKNKYYNKLLDPTDPKIDVVRAIIHELPVSHNSDIRIKSSGLLDDSESLDQTIELLNRVYNDDSTGNRVITRKVIRKKIFSVGLLLQLEIAKYIDANSTAGEKSLAKEKIEHLMRSEQEFSAFLRWVILNDTDLQADFSGFID